MIRDIVEGTTAAAAQSDRWLFIGTLIILGLFALAVMRYFVRQHEQLISDHKIAREAYQASLLNIVAKQAETTGAMSKVIEGNTAAMHDCTHELRLCREQRA